MTSTSVEQDRPSSRRWIGIALLIAVIAVGLAIGSQQPDSSDAAVDPEASPPPLGWAGPVHGGRLTGQFLRPEGDGTFSWGDGFDAASGWVDIVDVAWMPEGQIHWWLGLAGRPPPAAELEPSRRIAYGLVLDAAGDGVADYVVGIENQPPPSQDLRVWVTDLASGEVEQQIGPPYGFPVEFAHPQEQGLPGAEGRPSTMLFTFLGGSRPAGVDGRMTRFYAWASTSVGGEVVAWDYAPNDAWLAMPPSQ